MPLDRMGRYSQTSWTCLLLEGLTLIKLLLSLMGLLLKAQSFAFEVLTVMKLLLSLMEFLKKAQTFVFEGLTLMKLLLSLMGLLLKAQTQVSVAASDGS